MIEQQEEGNVARGKRVIPWKAMDHAEKNLCIHTLILKKPTWRHNVEHFSSGTLYCQSCRVFLTSLGGHAVPVPDYLDDMQWAFTALKDFFTKHQSESVIPRILCEELFGYAYIDMRPAEALEHMCLWNAEKIWVSLLITLGYEVESV